MAATYVPKVLYVRYAQGIISSLLLRLSLVRIEFLLSSKTLTLELLNWNPPPVLEVKTEPVWEFIAAGTPPVPDVLLGSLNSLGVDIPLAPLL